MRSITLLIVLFLIAACAATDRSISAKSGIKPPANDRQLQAQEQFAGCPGATALGQAADVSWGSQTSRLADHLSLRSRLNHPVPIGVMRILYWSSAAHHTSVSFSVIAVRDIRGKWRTSGIGEEGPGLLRIQPRALEVLDRELSDEQGRALDRALADPCLYASPRFQRDINIVPGGAVQTIEIEMPKRKWISSWFGSRSPQVSAVVQLIGS